MMRMGLISLIILVAVYLFLQGRISDRSSEKPIFLQVDKIALSHETKINIKLESKFKPDSLQLETLINNYSNIWAHLNHLYSTNDIISGKEFYTENWFKHLTANYKETINAPVKREDKNHNLIIKNWSSDGLVCTAIDSNILISYTYLNHKIDTSYISMAVVLLFQGDNWRIDALKVLN